MPKQDVLTVRKKQAKLAGVPAGRGRKSAKSHTRERFGMDPTITTSKTAQSVDMRRAPGGGPVPANNEAVMAMGVSKDENKRLANQAGRMKQMMLNTRKTNQFRAEQRRARIGGAARTGGAIGVGLGALGLVGDAMKTDEAAVNKAKSLERQGKPNVMAAAGNRESLLGQRQGRMFNEKGQPTAQVSAGKAPSAKPVISQKSASSKPAARQAQVTKLLKIK